MEINGDTYPVMMNTINISLNQIKILMVEMVGRCLFEYTNQVLLEVSILLYM